jgi:D-3-phosphoglycerate dehydrogenase
MALSEEGVRTGTWPGKGVRHDNGKRRDNRRRPTLLVDPGWFLDDGLVGHGFTRLLPAHWSTGVYRLVYTDYRYPDLSIEEAIVAPDGGQVAGFRCRSLAELIEAVRDADALVNTQIPITGEVMDAAPGLKGVVRSGVGFDNVDLEAATRRGVWVANVPDYCAEEVASHALALLLSLARKVVIIDAQMRAGVWDPNRAQPIFRLSECTLGVIGCGRIGQTLVRLASGLKMQVLGYDPYLPAEAAREAGIKLCALDEVLRESDLISLHLPLSNASRHLISTRELALMKATAYLVNTARGGLIDGAALAEALGAGRIAGAALDVFETEPLPEDHPLRSASNLILNYHIAWYSEQSLTTLREKAVQEAIRLARGEPPLHPVNRPERSAGG